MAKRSNDKTVTRCGLTVALSGFGLYLGGIKLSFRGIELLCRGNCSKFRGTGWSFGKLLLGFERSKLLFIGEASLALCLTLNIRSLRISTSYHRSVLAYS